jgi:hypothetical protein
MQLGIGCVVAGHPPLPAIPCLGFRGKAPPPQGPTPWQNIVDKHIIYENERYFTGTSFLLRGIETHNGALQWVLDFWYS